MSASSAMAVLVLSKIRICFMLFIACLVEVVCEVVSWTRIECCCPSKSTRVPER